MMHKNHDLKAVLELVMPKVQLFAKKHRYQDGALNKVKGELYTQIRRHLNSLVVQTNFKRENIGTFYMDRDGLIQYVEFTKYYGGSKHRTDFVEALNDAYESCNFDFKDILHKAELNELLEEVENYKIQF